MKKTLVILLVCILVMSGTSAFARNIDFTDYTQWPVSETDIPVDIYIFRSDAYGCDAKDMYFWNYFDQNSGLDFNIEQISEAAISERMSLMFASGELPDAVYGIPITTDDIVQFGAEEGLLLDMTP